MISTGIHNILEFLEQNVLYTMSVFMTFKANRPYLLVIVIQIMCGKQCRIYDWTNLARDQESP